ncbi:hypothetical protein ACN38_g12216 [Penicillium nordicum]|uniref:Uncharacterized protein n=1 Tax=Penicillium nordicum TaxID=229535 RepID=A0A0M9WA54_9EURO|nr:hypothetical protein ACN38_g12216 [Penicillium nordicum]
MSDEPITLPDMSNVQQPANVYYFRPYSFYWPGAFIFVGAFACSALTGTVNTSTSVLLWTVYLLGLFTILLIDPLCIFEQKHIDENGCPFTVRRPLVGFRSCEQVIPLEVLERGLYRVEDDEDQPRLRDGYRYGPAFFRI